MYIMCEKKSSLVSTPLRNGKGVNKPFRSPFANRNTSHNDVGIKKSEDIITSKICKPELQITEKHQLSPERSPTKRPCIDHKINSEDVQTASNVHVYSADLLTIKKRIHNKQQRINQLQTRLLYSKKHNVEDLKSSIEKWRSSCQEALSKLCKETTERNGKLIKMSDILSSLGIPTSLVHYSPTEDTFEQ